MTKIRRKKINTLKVISLIFTFIIIIIISIVNISKKTNNKPTTYNASILAVGDIMAHQDQLDAQYDPSTDSYSFDNNFKHVKKYIENADYSIANLETTLAGNKDRPYSAYPLFNSPDELADALKNTGFDLISTINNHSFDMGSLGVNRTLSLLKKKGFDTVGTRENSSDDDYIIKNINNINLGITSYSFGEVQDNTKSLNGIQVSNDCKDKMNIFDYRDVDSAFETIYSTVKKMSNSDLQIVIIHWGNEYKRSESNFQKELAQKLCDAGVDIIIGSHPNVVQPMETITSSNGDNETVVIYSLGNYISNQSRENVGIYSEDGLMVNIDITKSIESNEVKIEKVTCIPTWVNKYSKNNKYHYEIIPIEDKDTLDNISNLNKSKIKQSYENTSSLIDSSDLINIVQSPFN